MHVESLYDEPFAPFGELNCNTIAGLYQSKLNSFPMQPYGAIGWNIKLRFTRQKADIQLAPDKIDILNDPASLLAAVHRRDGRGRSTSGGVIHGKPYQGNPHANRARIRREAASILPR